MTIKDFEKATVERLSKLDIKGLKEVANFCADKFDTQFNVINDVAIELLSQRMSEEDFINFCNEY